MIGKSMEVARSTKILFGADIICSLSFISPLFFKLFVDVFYEIRSKIFSFGKIAYVHMCSDLYFPLSRIRVTS